MLDLFGFSKPLPKTREEFVDYIRFHPVPFSLFMSEDTDKIVTKALDIYDRVHEYMDFDGVTIPTNETIASQKRKFCIYFKDKKRRYEKTFTIILEQGTVNCKESTTYQWRTNGN